MLCRYVVIDNYVSREIAARSRSEVLNVFRQGEPPPRQSSSGHTIIDVLMHAGRFVHCQEIMRICVPIQTLHAACRQVPRSCTLVCRPDEGVYRYIYSHDIQLPFENKCAAPAQRQQALSWTSAEMMLTVVPELCSQLCRQVSAGGPHPVAASWEAPCRPKQPPHEPCACSPGAQS